MKTRYYKLNEYEDYLYDLKKRKLDFELSLTTYSRKIKTQSYIVMFNEDGAGDYSTLKLINNVRNDAKKYSLLGGGVQDGYIHFFDLLNKPENNKLVSKVDIRGAYWNRAIKKGVISNNTNEKFIDLFSGSPAEDMKKARLRALGSLATQKRIEIYERGCIIPESIRVETQPTKPIYMGICEDIDTLMRDVSYNTPGVFYYYWDCVFVAKEYTKDVVKYIKEKEYDVKVNETKLEYVEVGDSGYIVSTTDEKIYMVRKESRHLLEDLNDYSGDYNNLKTPFGRPVNINNFVDRRDTNMFINEGDFDIPMFEKKKK